MTKANRGQTAQKKPTDDPRAWESAVRITENRIRAIRAWFGVDHSRVEEIIEYLHQNLLERLSLLAAESRSERIARLVGAVALFTPKRDSRYWELQIFQNDLNLPLPKDVGHVDLRPWQIEDPDLLKAARQMRIADPPQHNSVPYTPPDYSRWN